MADGVTILIPTALRQFADGQEQVRLAGATVGEVLGQLTGAHSDLKKHLYNDSGQLRSFVNVYLNDEDIRYLEKDKTAVSDGDTITIVPSIAGGAATMETVELSPEEIGRYSRHLIMPEVTLEGQKKLKQARVLLVGAGGLGAPLGLYLTAAGVGHIGIVDADVVDSSNLQRQVTYTTEDIGTSKLEAAKRRLTALNPFTEISTYETRLSSENALEIFKDYDIIVDGTDNFPTRYLVNDACVLLGKPNVYGSIFRFEGQVSIFYAKEGPCYRCLYPEPPPPGLVPSCAEGGVLGVLPGIVGALQAAETLKLIIGIGDPLVGRLLRFDALKMQFREYKLRRDPNCPICGEHPSLHGLIDYDEFCGITPGPEVNLDAQWEITPTEVKQRLDRGEHLVIVDVREPHEWALGTIKAPDVRFIPVGDVPARMHELNSADEIILQCRSGVRSARALGILQDAGFRKLKNLTGGILAWSDEVDPSIPKY
jgi:molybdopterin/thiamine biosynthesis adenylyltransferase/rhodanese-related sulfurtransferase/molybdopterin converting factor small subunit